MFLQPKWPVSQNKWVKLNSKCQNPPTGKLQEAPITIIGEKNSTAIPPSIRNEPSEIGGPGTQNNRSLINLKPSVFKPMPHIPTHFPLVEGAKTAFILFSTKEDTKKNIWNSQTDMSQKMFKQKSFQTKMIMIWMLFDDARFTSKLNIWKKTHTSSDRSSQSPKPPDGLPAEFPGSPWNTAQLSRNILQSHLQVIRRSMYRIQTIIKDGIFLRFSHHFKMMILDRLFHAMYHPSNSDWMFKLISTISKLHGHSF